MIIFYKGWHIVQWCLYIALKLSFQNIAAKTGQNFSSPAKSPSNLIWTQYSWSSVSINCLNLLEFQVIYSIWNKASITYMVKQHFSLQWDFFLTACLRPSCLMRFIIFFSSFLIMPALVSSIPLEFPRGLFSHLLFCGAEETAFPSSTPACRISELRMGSNCLFPWLGRSRNKKYFSDVAAIASQWPITQPGVKVCKSAICAESSLVIVWVDWGNKQCIM